MPKLTKESLEVVSIPFFTSPVDGQTYTVTVAAEIAANIRDMLFTGLRQVSATEYAKVRAAEVAAIKASDATALRAVFVLLVGTVASLIPSNKPEHPLIRKARHDMTDMVAVLSPEVHAQYRAVKYAGAQDQGEGKTPKADPAKRAEALALVAEVLAKAALVPGF